MRWRASTSAKVECPWKSLKQRCFENTAIRQGCPSNGVNSGLSNAYMDTILGLYVLQEHKDRINKKTTFPTIKTIHWRSAFCRGMYSNEDKTTFDDLWYKCQCWQEFSVEALKTVVVDGKDTICVLPGEYGRSLSDWLPPYVCDWMCVFFKQQWQTKTKQKTLRQQGSKLVSF